MLNYVIRRRGLVARTILAGLIVGQDFRLGLDLIRREKEEAEKKKRKYLLYLLALFALYGLSDPYRFIQLLKRANSTTLPEFADMGYRQTHGFNPTTPGPWRSAAARFVNSFADGFRAALISRSGVLDYRRRTLMYGEEGYRTAFLHGIQAAMAERGATHWQRVLHPELSLSGPCPLCVEDAAFIHPISEPFKSLHPNEVCTANPLSLRFAGAGGEINFGVPGLTENDITELLRQQGIDPENLIRRTGVT